MRSWAVCDDHAVAATDRIVRLVLVGHDGQPFGLTEPFPAELPWWQEVGPVVRGARAHLGIEVVVLRLLEAGPWPGGEVTYVAEVDGPGPATLGAAPALADHPLRLPWARPGGPAADLAWATAALEHVDRPLVAPPEQVRSWNLSSLWRLPTSAGPAWLKAVPPFFAHEAAAIALLDDPVLPTLLAGGPGRALLDDAPGVDGYDVDDEAWLSQVGHLVRLQARWLDREDELLVYRIEATAFLKHMVRNIIGTLVEVGSGARPAADVSAVLASRDRGRAGPTAPPHGLCLVAVRY